MTPTEICGRIEPDQTRHDAHQRLLSGIIVVACANGPTLQVAKRPDFLFPKDLEAPEMQAAQDRQRYAGIHTHDQRWRKLPAEIDFAMCNHIRNNIRFGGIGSTQMGFGGVDILDIGKTLGVQQFLEHLRGQAGGAVFFEANCGDFRWRLGSERSSAAEEAGGTCECKAG